MTSTRNILLAAVIATLGAAPALADGKGKDKGDKHRDKVSQVDRHGGKKDGKHARSYADRRGHRDGDDYRYRHRDDDRHAYAGDYRRCPPGLAKKNNGCLPPGQAKKLAVGHPVPAGAVYTIPRHVLVTLPPPPYGHQYAIVNNRVVLVSQTHIVVDILRSLVG